MDPPNISPQLERLDDEIDNLEEALQPILNNVSDVANKLPLLDKAKLYVLVTYSIESMLFSSLRLNGVNAKEHPVFKELTRVRQYFDKIKNAENPPQQKPEQSLNKEAAIRFIRADLAENNNKAVNAKLTEMIAKEKAQAALKAARLGQKRKAEESTPEERQSVAESSSDEIEVDEEASRKKKRKEKKDKKDKKEGKKHKDKRSKKSS
ncbi:Sas10/Utp3/C1D family-domain-containing protein [Hypoxylon sp. FL1857]|nr:Sas10/Utp3/C1D family-domain-containing protein [Hypoxylon sp. FL1857]